MKLTPIIGKAYLQIYRQIQTLLVSRWGWKENLLRRSLRKLNRIIQPRALRTLSNPLQASGFAFSWSESIHYYVRELASGMYEQETLRIFRQIVPTGGTVVDAGAHIGWYTCHAAALVGSGGRVYAFEPDPAVFPFLHRNVELNAFGQIVRTIQKAVSDVNGTALLFHHPLRSGQSNIQAPLPDFVASHVDAITLDTFFEQEGWPQVDVVKFDIEGAEIQAFRGMRRLVQRNPRLKMIAEFHPGILKTAKAGNEFFGELQDLGLRKFMALRGFSHPKSLRIPEEVSWLLDTSEVQNILCEI